MRLSKALVPTLREDPRDAENVSHKLLLRGGYIKQIAAGVYTFLPLGWRVMKKIYRIITEEMDRIGAQEMLMPALTPADLWEESGRWEAFGDDMFRLKDRKGKDYALAPTHEEVIAEIARKFVHSYKDLPQIWYQVQTKFRDEPRPRGGLLRVREFLMKDSYSLHADWESLDEAYEQHREAYKRIFTRSGLKFVHVKASSGLMGGKQSEEFMVVSDAGEDELAICESCGYAANTEVAVADVPDHAESRYNKFEKVYTPGLTTVEEVARSLKVEPKHIIKSVVYYVNDTPYLVLIRGDYEVNEEKLASLLGGKPLYATDEDIIGLGSYPGFIGPHGLKDVKIIADESVKYVRNAVIGANEKDYHYVGYNGHLNLDAYYDIRKVKEGDVCRECGGRIKVVNAIEIGHIFKLGTRYSESMGATFLDRDGKRKPIIMGSYGIGLGRIMASAIELYHDENGIIWPLPIAPYHAIIIEIDEESGVAPRIYDELWKAGVEVMWDDRDERPGVKFKDADLIGIPFKIVVGRKAADGVVEVQRRRDGHRWDIPLEQFVDEFKRILDEEMELYELKE